VVAAFDPHTESDPIGLLVQFLVMFGSLAGRGPRYHVEATPHHVNEFAVLVGRSSMGRKGTDAGRVKALLKEVDPGWASGRLRSGLSTGEGLIGMVRDPLYEKQPIKSKGRVVDYQEVMTDEGVSDKRLCMLETEFGAALKALEREGNRLSGVLRLAWDGEALATATKSPVRATDAHVSIVGHITRDELLSLIQRVEIASGLANRFLWLAVRRCRVLPFGGSPGDLSPLIRQTADAAEFARGADLVTMSRPARGLWCDHYDRLTTPPPGALGEVLSRGAPHVIRLAMLYALTDRESVITDDHLRAALALWDASARCAAFIFGDGTGDRTADRILAALRAAPGGMTRSEIRRSVFGDHVTAARVRAALSFLLSAGQVCQVADRATGGAPAIRYFAVRERERREKRDNPRRAGARRGLPTLITLFTPTPARSQRIRAAPPRRTRRSSSHDAPRPDHGPRGESCRAPRPGFWRPSCSTPWPPASPCSLLAAVKVPRLPVLRRCRARRDPGRERPRAGGGAMRRHYPDPRQGLFRWVWSDQDDDRPDAPDDEPSTGLPSLRARVRQRHGPRPVVLWGTPVVVRNAPGSPVGRSVTLGRGLRTVRPLRAPTRG
jgi:hypothetical protein